jgi:hypothetical protein
MAISSIVLKRSTEVLKRSTDHVSYKSVGVVLTLLAVALITRGDRIGDPAIHVDEQYYLLVADRMWHGALPYVDIWDRKPILLFLIYAALRPFSPDGIVAYQIGALLFATCTAFVIVHIAQRFTNPLGAWLAGVAYLLYLPALHGDGGQTAVFYNLFLALGALEIFRASDAPEPTHIWRHGLRAMLWAGLAIQVKYIAAIEGIAYGIWLIVLLIRGNRCSFSHIAVLAGLWAAVALAPTLVAAGFYALIGHGQEFVQANFLSIFQKHQPAAFPSDDILWMSGVKLAPLLFIAFFSIPLLLRSKAAGIQVTFLLFWTAAALVDFFAIGNYYDHYALPFTVPMMIVCAPLLGTYIGGIVGIMVFGAVAIIATNFFSSSLKQFHQRQVAAIAEAVQPYTAHGCIYLHDGPTIVYLLTHSCLPSRYPFPGHLNEQAEAGATDATRNMASLLATRPPAILVMDRPTLETPNPITAAMLKAALVSDYERIGIFQDVFSTRYQILYARRDLLPQRKR